MSITRNRYFHGGIHPYDGKELTRYLPIEDLTPPERLVVPLLQHIGTHAKPMVRVGDALSLGQPIGDVDGSISSPVHSPVSGTVEAIEERLHPNGRMVLSVVIANDGLDTPHTSVTPHPIVESDCSNSVAEIMQNAGIVGMGGAAFPAHYKLLSGVGKADTLIINAAECEPYITSDHRMLLEHPDEVLSGIRSIAKALKLDTATLAIESNKDDAIALLKSIIRPDIKPSIKLVSL
ncbi:MAG: electron transport complex subunit RsxC, partial [Oscillospiraceae bacterium]|nr:electron transport complex subunit RsxC [Oscillospiraceae bacterium]